MLLELCFSPNSLIVVNLLIFRAKDLPPQVDQVRSNEQVNADLRAGLSHHIQYSSGLNYFKGPTLIDGTILQWKK